MANRNNSETSDPMDSMLGLKRWLEANSVRQGDFAEQIGASQSTISKWISGSAPPQHASLRKVMSATGLKFEELYPSDSDAAGSRAKAA